MQKFRFLLLTYWFESPGFLKEVTRVVRNVPLCGNLQNTFFLTHSPTSHLCHTPGLTHTTPQLHLRWDRPMFAAADFKPSDMRFNISWSA